MLLGWGPAFSASSPTATVSFSYSAPSLLVNVVSSVGVGSWQVEVDVPSSVSVGSASESGFMTGASNFFNPPSQYRWFNLQANGQTTGGLTIPVTYSGIYTITLAIVDLQDVNGVSITVNPPLPINLVPPQISLLVTGPSSATRGGSATFDVIATNLGSSVSTTLLLEVIGPGGYYYFDTMQISAPAVGTGRFQFTWQIPSSVQAGSYQVNVGLIPPTPTSISQAQIAVN